MIDTPTPQNLGPVNLSVDAAGDVNFSLSGDADMSNYNVTGATMNGNDWVITIHTRQTTATLTVTPNADTDIEPDEIVIVTILPTP